MNVSTLFVENLQTSNIYNMNDIRTTQFSLNSLGTYVYNVLNSSTIQTLQSQFINYSNLNTSNLFVYLPQSNQTPTLENQLVTKTYVDNSFTTTNHTWSGLNTFNNTITTLNGIINNTSTMNITLPQQIGYTYTSNWSTQTNINSSLATIDTIVFNTPGVWQIHAQYEFFGEGILTQINAGFNDGTMFNNGIMYQEDSTIAIETNDVLQRFVPYIFTNQQGTSTLQLVSNGQVNTGTIYCRCKYFYVRIA